MENGIEWNPEELAQHMLGWINDGHADAMAYIFAHEDGRTDKVYLGKQRIDGPLSDVALHTIEGKFRKLKEAGFTPVAVFTAKLRKDGKEVAFQRHGTTLLFEEQEKDYVVICEAMFVQGTLPKDVFQTLRSVARTFYNNPIKSDLERLVKVRKTIESAARSGATIVYNLNKG